MCIIYNNVYNMRRYRGTNIDSFNAAKYVVSGLLLIPSYIFYAYMHHNIRDKWGLYMIFLLKFMYKRGII